MLDFTRDEATFEKYDRMTAHELFLRMGLSKRLVSDFIKPTLLVSSPQKHQLIAFGATK